MAWPRWALRFLILTAARTGEALNARWDEIDLDAKIWTVPAARMKAGREHRVPLSKPATGILEKLLETKTFILKPEYRVDFDDVGKNLSFVRMVGQKNPKLKPI
jgi:integrase